MKTIKTYVILMMIAFMATALQSCSERLPDGELVQLSFSATLPAQRSFGDGTRADMLVVGILDKDYREIDRKRFVIDGATVDMYLTLAKEQTYSLVFWAYDSSADVYDLSDLCAVRMQSYPEEMTFTAAEAADAFFATARIKVEGIHHYDIRLVRPLAQVNVGTTGMPAEASLTMKAAPDTFHPFTRSVSGEADFTLNFTGTTDETFLVEEAEYSYLALGYVFAPEAPIQIDMELALQDDRYVFRDVSLQANSRSNIAGNFTDRNMENKTYKQLLTF